jgi:hypothetical protein
VAVGKKYGGRQKGTKNKVTQNVKELAAPHGPDAIKVLVEIMMDESAGKSYRIAASKEIMDRAYGKAPQHIEQKHQFQESEMSDLEIARRIAFIFNQGLESQTLQ